VDVLASLEEIKQLDWVDEEGERMEMSFFPGLSEEQLDGLEADMGTTLPADYRALAAVCGGIEGGSLEIDFSGFGETWVAPLLPHYVAFAHDGSGNHWVIDCTSEPSERSHIFYSCHDAPVLLFQGVGMAEFLKQVYHYETGDRWSDIWGVFGDSRFHVWQTNPGTIGRKEALASPDATIRELAGYLDDRFSIIDLRNVPPGMGFSWGRDGYGEIERFGEERIFVYADLSKEAGGE
jgi:cell wall assembly regulator SMI1